MAKALGSPVKQYVITSARAQSEHLDRRATVGGRKGAKGRKARKTEKEEVCSEWCLMSIGAHCCSQDEELMAAGEADIDSADVRLRCVSARFPHL
jgi:hypothetical protein